MTNLTFGCILGLDVCFQHKPSRTWQKCVKWYYLVADDIRTYIHIVVAWASDLPSAASIVSLERSSDRIKMGGLWVLSW